MNLNDSKIGDHLSISKYINPLKNISDMDALSVNSLNLTTGAQKPLPTYHNVPVLPPLMKQSLI